MIKFAKDARVMSTLHFRVGTVIRVYGATQENPRPEHIYYEVEWDTEHLDFNRVTNTTQDYLVAYSE